MKNLDFAPIALICIFALGLPASKAEATCPGTWYGLDCLIPSNPTAAACWYDTGDDIIKCDRFGSQDDVVYAYTDSGVTYVFGTGRGDDFCCTFSGDYVPIYITTMDGDDFIQLYWGDQFAYIYEEDSEVLAGDGDDIVHGSPHDDCTYPCDDIQVGDGEDFVRGYAGADRIIAPSDDADTNTFYGGDDGDKMTGGAGGDSLYGDDGADVIRGGAGTDTIEGNGGNDWINANDGRDISLEGGAGNDTVCGGPGVETWVYGNAGTDTCSGDDEDTLHSSCETKVDDCPSAPW